MCRAGGRRCPNAGGRSTQNTRKAVSRARRALRQAQQTGNPTEITAARDRLTAARTAHHHAKDTTVNHHDNGQDHTADPPTTAGHDRDVTPPATDDTTTQPSTQDSRTRRYGGIVLHNTNIAHPGSHVGSQHDVHHGTTRFTTRANPAARHDRDVTDHDQGDTTADHGDRHDGSRNVASGNDYVTQQVGFTLADLRRKTRRR